MISERAKLFDDDPEGEPDLSRFTPVADPPTAPPLEQVRGVSSAAGFPNRDAVRPIPPAPANPPAAERYYYRTGRDTQFNTKVRPDVKAAYVSIANEDGIPIGRVLELALEALQRERGKG
jgi:hypothetical protein